MPIPYLINTFRGGISDEDDKGISGSFKYGHALDIHKRGDTLSADQAMLTETNLSGLVNFFVQAFDGSTYAFCANGSIYARTGNSGDPDWNFARNDENGAIRGADIWSDSDVSTNPNGDTYMYWATATSLARANINGSLDVPWAAGVATQDYKGALESAEWHTMHQAGGQLNIANDYSISSVDYDSNFIYQELIIRPGNTARTLEERDDYLIIGSGRGDRSEQGHLWSWLKAANNWIQKKRIPVKGINAMINAEDHVMQGGLDGELFFTDFVNSVPLQAVPGGGSVDPGGVAIHTDLAAFGFSGNENGYEGIWTYGRRMKNRPKAFNYQYRVDATVNGSTATIGAVANVDGTLLASWWTQDGSTHEYGVDAVSTTTKASAVYEGLEFDAGAPHRRKPFEQVKLVMDPFPASCSVAAKYKVDGESAWRYGVLGSGETTFSVSGATEADFTVSRTIGKFYEVGVEIEPHENTSPKIRSIVTDISDSGGKSHG